jgi:hypothetical protein
LESLLRTFDVCRNSRTFGFLLRFLPPDFSELRALFSSLTDQELAVHLDEIVACSPGRVNVNAIAPGNTANPDE